MSRPSHAVTLLLTLGAVLAPLSLAGQTPGYQKIDTRSIFAEFHAEVLGEVNELMADWSEAWAEDRPEDVLDAYWDEAMLIPPGGGPPLRGRAAIEAWLIESLPSQGAMEAFLLDFDASGGMAVVSGNYLLQEPGNAATALSGPVVTVYLLRGRTWKIRSQVFTRTDGS